MERFDKEVDDGFREVERLEISSSRSPRGEWFSEGTIKDDFRCEEGRLQTQS